MVVQKAATCFVMWSCILALLLTSNAALASIELNATVDRDKVYQNDTINLQLTGNMEVDMSIGGLLSFGRNQMEAPDTTALTEDFEILDQRQSYSMKTMNGVSRSLTTWSYTLAPKRSGQLSIPAIEYQGAASAMIPIQVVAGSAPKNNNNPPPLFIEVEINKPVAYVQEQLVYTVRLYAVAQVRGELTDPSPLNSIVERLGETKKYYRMAYNQRYEVQENTYLIFPQQSGSLDVEAQSFNGFVVDPRTRRRVHVRELSDTLTVTIKPPPPSFSGDVWLPAMNLELNEQWEQSPDTIKVGDSLTRNIEVKALGLLGSALPPIATDDLPGFKVYPDQPAIESFAHEEGVQSVRQETTALVAVTGGDAKLPEIKLAWWDTVQDVERIAVIPSRQLNIEALNQPANAPTAPVQSAEPSELAAQTSTQPESKNVAVGSIDQPNTTAWWLMIALLLMGWASTTWLLLGKLKQRPSELVDSNDSPVDTKHLIKAVKNDDPDFIRLLIDWLQRTLRTSTILSLRDIPDELSDLRGAAEAFEAKHYGAARQGTTYSDTALITAIQRAAKQHKQPKKQDKVRLQPLYP